MTRPGAYLLARFRAGVGAGKRSLTLIAVLCALAFLSSFGASGVYAQCTTTTATYQGPSMSPDNNWSVGGNWSTGTSPNDSGATCYNVVINDASPTLVNFDSSPVTIGSLTLAAADTLQANGGQDLTIGDPGNSIVAQLNIASGGDLSWGDRDGGTITIDVSALGFQHDNSSSPLIDNGIINLGNSSGSASLLFSDNSNQDAIFIEGTGSINLNSSLSKIGGVTGDEQLQSYVAINGIGTINLDLINNGSVNADSSVGTLTLTPTGKSANPGIANAGTMNVSTGATMVWDTTQYQGTGLSAPGSAFNNTGSGSVNVASDSTLEILGVSGKTSYITNNGAIYLGSGMPNLGPAEILLSGNGATFDIGPQGGPTGTINLGEYNSTIAGATGGEVLLNDTGNTITGIGTIKNLQLFNNGTITADGSIATGAGLTLEADGSNNITNNAGGVMSVINSGSMTWLTANVIGTSFYNYGTVNVGNNTLAETDQLQWSTTLGLGFDPFVGINNEGTINLNGQTAGANPTLQLYDYNQGDNFDLFSTGGTGVLNMYGNATITGFGNDMTLTNDTGSTIQGTGLITSLNLVNNGTITADGSYDPNGVAQNSIGVTPQTLTIEMFSGNVMTNNGVINVINDGTLNFQTDVAANQVPNYTAPTAFINNGTINVNTDFSQGTLEFSTNSLTDNNYFETIGIENEGTINLSGELILSDNGYQDNFSLYSNNGTGVLNMYFAAIAGDGTYNDENFVNGTGNTINATGIDFIETDFQNYGTVNVNSGLLDISWTGLSGILGAVNYGAINVGSDGKLELDFSNYQGYLNSDLYQGSAFANAGGTITVADGGVLQLNNPSLTNIAYLDNFGGGAITLGTVTGSGATMLLTGATFDIDSGSHTGPSTGTITMNGDSQIMGSGGATLINDTGNTIQGTGTISQLSLVNNGTITTANNAGGFQLTIEADGTNNITNGVGGVMNVVGGSILAWNTTAAPNSFFNYGTVNVTDSGSSGANYLILETTTSTPGLTIGISNQGTINLGQTTGGNLYLSDGNNGQNGDTFIISGTAGSPGIINMYGTSTIEGQGTGSKLPTLINGTNETIQGTGTISSLTALVNYGTINVGPTSTNPSGTGTLTLDSLTNGFFNDGQVNVGTGDTLQVNSLAGFVAVGETGTGNMLVNGGGAVNVLGSGGGPFNGQSLLVGDQTGSVGTVTVDGSGTSFTNSGGVILGVNGTGTLNVTNGASFSATSIIAGDSLAGNGGSGTFTFSGGSTVQIGGYLVLGGQDGTGGIGIGTIGTSTGPADTTNVTVGAYATIGETAGSTGTLTVQNGATVTVNEGAGSIGLLIGQNAASGLLNAASGSLTLTGAGTTWTNSNSQAVIGYSGTGTLSILDGAQLSTSGASVSGTSSSGIIGVGLGGTGSGTVTVDGTGSIWNLNGGGLLLGDLAGGVGALTVSNGGVVDSGIGTIGFHSTSANSVTVTGAGSTWNIGVGAAAGTLNNNGELFVGGGSLYDYNSGDANYKTYVQGTGNGSLTVSAGGLVSDVSATVGIGTGMVTVTGANSKWTTSGALTVDAGGTVYVQDGTQNHSPTVHAGTLTNAGTITTGNATDDTGFNLISVTGLITNSGAITLDGANDSLTAGGGFTNNSGGSLTFDSSGLVNGSSITGTFNNNNGASVNFDSGASKYLLSVIGAFNNNGTITMSGSGDTLQQAAGLFTNTGLVTIGSGETLNANGIGYGYTQTAGSTTISGILNTTLLVNDTTIHLQGTNSLLDASVSSNNSGAIVLLGTGDTFTTVNANDNSGSLTNSGDIGLNAANDVMNVGTGGVVSNIGNITVAGTGAHFVDLGGFTSNTGGGTLDFNAANTMSAPALSTVTGNFVNNSSAQLNFQSGGSYNDLTVSGTFTNGGSVSMLGADDILTTTGLFTNNDTVGISTSETLQANGGFSNSAGIVTLTGGTLNSAEGFTNSAALTMNGASGLVSVTGAFSNSGTISMVGSGDQLNVSGLFTNTSTVGIGAGETINANGGYSQTAGTTTVNGNLSDAVNISIGGGGLEGTGTLTGAVVVNGGAIGGGAFATSLSVGTLTITGTLSLGSSTASTVYEMVGGPTPAASAINATGVVTLGTVSLNLNVLSSFTTAATGTTFTILSGGSGTNLSSSLFSNTSAIDSTTLDSGADHWELVYNATNVELEVEANGATDVTATWNTGAGNWNTATQWSCTPGPVNCVPNNVSGTTVYEAVLDSTAAGNILELDDTRPLTTVNTLTMTEGTLQIDKGATLELINQPGGITDINANSGLILNGSFVEANGTTSALSGLGSVEGLLTLANGQTTTVTPSGGTFTNSGTLNVQQTSTFSVTGAFTNSGVVNTGNGTMDSGGNAITVSGVLTNSGTITLSGMNDTLTADLTNSGAININGIGDTLADTGAFDNQSGGSLTFNATNTSAANSSVDGNFTNESGASLNFTSGKSAKNNLYVGNAFTNNSGATVNMAGTNDTLTVAGLFTNSSSTGGGVTIGASETLTADDAFTNNAGGTVNVTGGTLTALSTLMNSGTITLSGTSATLTSTGLFTNVATVGIGAGDTLTANGGYTQQTSGTASTTVNGASALLAVTNGLTISTGTLNIQDGGKVTADTATNSASIFLGNASSDSGNNKLTVSGLLTNNSSGAITLAAAGDALSAGTLSNAGTITLSGVGAGITLGSGASTNSNTITSSGVGNGLNIGGTLANSGTISATAGAVAVFGAGTITNTGTIEANGGTLQVLGMTIDNAGGNITANTGGTVDLTEGTDIQGGTLNTTGTGLLQTFAGVPVTATLDGSTGSGAVTLSTSSTYTTGSGATTKLLGTITNEGNFATSGTLNIGGAVMLNGGGTVTLSGSGSVSGTSVTLTNVNNTIQGVGTIGGGVLAVNNGGTIDANVSAGTLLLNSTGTVTNANGATAGLLEATNGGTLAISTVVNNTTSTPSAANITAGSGSIVELENGVIRGGNLNITGTAETIGSGTLDGSTFGALTINGNFTSASGNSTELLGTINNNGTFALGGQLGLFGAVSLQDSGTVTMTSGSVIQALGSGTTLTNVNNAIQGVGTIGGGSLAVKNGSTIDANVSAGTLLLNGTGGITNANGATAGLLEATSGGTLDIQNIVNNTTSTPTAANITANGGTVLIDGATIEGGDLNVTGGGTMETVAGKSATLDGSSFGALTITAGNLSVVNNSILDLRGTITNNGTILLSGGSGTNSELQMNASTVTLNGSGTITMATATGGGFAEISGTSAQTLDNVNNLIQGAGEITGGMQFTNTGTVNANSTAGTGVLSLSTATTNTSGLLEASGGGVLNITSTAVVNNGGNITANTGSTVELSGLATIQGGTLNTGGTAVMETLGTGYLDGSSAAGAVTLSTGSTYTTGSGATTNFLGTITNNGNFATAGTLNISAAVMLNGGGTVTLTSGSNITGTGNTLTNVNNTIEGVGTIGDGSLALVNQSSGEILANGGATLGVHLSSLSNAGTLQANSGSTMAFASGSGTTTNTGTVNAAGTISFASGDTFTQTAGTTTVGGNFGGTGATLNFSGGLLQGTGTVTGAVAVNGGAIAGGQFTGTQSIGTLNITGTFSIGSSTASTFNEMISGSLAADTSLVKATGTLTLGANASLSLNLLSTFTTASTGTTYTILSGSSLTGMFSNTSAIDATTLDSGADHWQLVYNDSSGTVELEAEANTAAPVTATFAGSSTSAVWTTATNWGCSPSISPTPCVPNNSSSYGFTADIDSTAGTGVMNLSTAETINALNVEQGTLNIGSGGNLTVNGATSVQSNGTSTKLQFSGGTLTNNGAITDNGNITGFGIITGGSLTVASTEPLGSPIPAYLQAQGGTLNVSGTNLTNYNSSTMTLSGGIYAEFIAGGGFANPGTLELPGDITTNSAYLEINEENGSSPGIVDSSGTNSALTNFNTNNGGFFNLESGANFSTAGNSVSGIFTNENSSLLEVAGYGDVSGLVYSTLTITGSLTNSNSSSVFADADGVITINNNLMNTGGSTVEAESAGMITVTGILSNDSTSTVSVFGGTIQAGTLNNVGGKVNLDDSGTITAGSMTTSGTVTLGNENFGDEALSVTNTLNNQSGGTITLEAFGDEVIAGTLTNGGTITLGGTSYASTMGTNQVLSVGTGGATNTGTITFSPGTITVSSPYTGNTLVDAGAFTNSGSGSALNFETDNSAATNSSVTGAFSNGGTLSMTGTHDILTVAGGFTNTGTVTIDTLENLTISADGYTQNTGGITTVNGASALLSVTGGLSINAGSLNIQDGGKVTADTLTNAGSIFLGNATSDTGGNKLSVSGLLTNTGSITVEGKNDNVSADLTNSGTMTFSGLGATLTDTGVFNNNNGGSLAFSASNTSLTTSTVAGAFNNSGGASVTLSGSDNVLTVTGLFTNGSSSGAAAVTVGTGDTLNANGGYTQSTSGTGTASTDVTGNLSTTTFSNQAGTTTVESGGKITATSFTISGGTVQGLGTLSGPVTVSSTGTILPGIGSTPGTLSVTGTFGMTGGTFDELFNGVTVGNFGALSVSSTANISGGDLSITFTGNAATGTAVTILSSTGLTGQFANTASIDGSSAGAGEHWELIYTADNAELEAVSGNLIAATWNTGTGNWNTATQWSCTPGPPANCVPDNGGVLTYAAVLDSTAAGNVLTLNAAGTTTVNSLTMTQGVLNIASGSTLELASQSAGITSINATSGLILDGSFVEADGSTSALHGLNNVAGTLTLANGQTTGVTPSGGTFTNSGTLNVQQSSTFSVIGGLTNSGNINTGNGASDSGSNKLTVTGLLTNNASGAISLAAVSDALSAGTLSNAGTITLSGNTETVTLGTGASTNSNTITSSGTGNSLSNTGTLSNSGTITASAGSFSLLGAISNTGTLKATSGGQLTLSSTIDNNSGNITSTGTGSIVQVNGATLQGGTLNTSSSGVMETNAGTTSTLDGSSFGALTISTGSTFTVTDNSTVNLKGTITNQGTILLNSTAGGNAALGYIGSVTLNGGGTVTMVNIPGSVSGIHAMTGTLDNVNNTIHGYGVIGGSVINTGTINADYSGSGSLLLNTVSMTNTGGLLEASSGGTLEIFNSTIVNNGGNITANTGSTVEMSSGVTIQGGTLNTVGTGVMQTLSGFTATLDGSSVAGAVTLSTGSTYTTGSSATTSFQGTITNEGNFATAGTLNIGGAVMLNGGGTVTMTSGSEITGTGNTLTNVNNTIEGVGTIGDGSLALVNQSGGEILANGGATLAVNLGSLSNAGTLQANSGSTMSFSSGSGTITNTGTVNALGTISLASGVNFTQTAGTTTVTGTFGGSGALVNIGGGTLQGTGAITGTVAMTGGTILPGAPGTPGTLSITGSFSMNTGGSGATLSELISGGTYGVLNVTGSANITAGDLSISLLSGSASASPVIILSTTTGLGGTMFANTGTIDGSAAGAGEHWELVYTTDDVELEALANGATTYSAIWGPGTGGVSANTTGNWYNGSSATEFACTSTGGAPYTNCLPNNVSGTSSYNVTLDSAGHTLTLDSTTTPASITVSSLAITAGTLNIATGGSLTVTGATTISDTLQLSGGTFSTGGAAGAITNSDYIMGAGTITGGGSLTNIGGILVADGGTLDLSGVVLANLSGGTLSGGEYIAGDVSAGTIKLAGDIVTNSAYIILDNAGSAIDDASGALADFVKNEGGTFTAENGATFATSGNFTNDGGSSLSANEIGSALTINGTLMNSNASNVSANNGGSVTVTGNLSNDSTSGIEVRNGGTLMAGSLTNSGAIYLGNGTPSDTGSNKLTVTGLLMNNAGGTVTLEAVSDSLTAGSLTNAGNITLQGNTESLMVTGAGGFGNTNTLTVSGNNDAVTVTDTLTNSGTITLSGMNDTLTADLDNSGPMNINGLGDKLVDTGAFNNLSGGSLNYNALNTSPVTSTVAGIFNNNGGASLNMAGSNDVLTITTGLFTNGSSSGLASVTIGANETLNANGGYTQSTSGTGTAGTDVTGKLSTTTFTNNAGTTTVEAGGQISATSFALNGGTLQGNGTVSAAVTMGAASTGMILPGLPGAPGTLTLTSLMMSGGTLDELTSPTKVGLLDVTDSATLGANSTLDLDNLGGFAPAVGLEYVILESSGLTGTFGTVDDTLFNNDTETWDVLYSPAGFTNEVVLEAELCTAADPGCNTGGGGGTTNTPEPGTLPLFIVGLLGLGFFYRRTRSAGSAR